jgi:hypothetical protein
MSEIFELFIYASKSTGVIILAALAGFSLVKTEVLPEESLKFFSKAVFCVMLPCLLFSKMAESIDIETLKSLYILPVSCLIYIFAGLSLGWLATRLLKLSGNTSRAVIAASGFGNSGFLPIPLIAAIVAVFPYFSDDPMAASKGISYISIYLMGFSPLMWTVGYKIVSPSKNISGFSLSRVITPPVAGLLAGIAIGLLPPLRNLFCAPEGMLNPVFKASEVIAGGTIPCALVVLGGKLASAPPLRNINFKTVLTVAGVKLLLLPVLAVFYVKFLFSYDFLPAEPLFALVLVIEAATPPANNLVVMCSLNNTDNQGTVASILFWNYLFSTVTLTFFMMLTMKLFS